MIQPVKCKVVAVCILCCAAGWQPASAQALPENRTYQRDSGEGPDLATLTGLAAAGNTSAMLRLGLLQWYGEGVPVDRAQADALFQRAALAGNRDAASYLRLSPGRQAQLGEIRRWTTEVDARQLAGASFDCKAPTLPAYSAFRFDAVKVGDSLASYRQCYNNYIDKLFGDVPAARRIPEAVARVMSDAEFEQARLRVDGVILQTVASMRQQSNHVLADTERWAVTSRSYIVNSDLRWRSDMDWFKQDAVMHGKKN